jgi:hypothetical protein
MSELKSKRNMSDTPDPVVEFYRKDVDMTLIRENLKRTVNERVQNLQQLAAAAEELRRAGPKHD